MTAEAILDQARSRGIRLSVTGGELRYRAPAGALTPELRAGLVEHKPVILALLRPAPDPCPCCGSTVRWVSVHGAVVCPLCHPPAAPWLVATWIGEAVSPAPDRARAGPPRGRGEGLTRNP